MMPLFKSAFLCIFSFGKRTPGCARRASECLILEPSEMIVVSYFFITRFCVEAQRPSQQLFSHVGIEPMLPGFN